MNWPIYTFYKAIELIEYLRGKRDIFVEFEIWADFERWQKYCFN